MLGGDAAAQDLVQDTFVKLWRNAEKYDTSRGKLETWVLLVARSLAIDALRRRVLEARSLEATGRPREDDPSAVRRSWPRPGIWRIAPDARCSASRRSSGPPSNSRTSGDVRAPKSPRWRGSRWA